MTKPNEQAPTDTKSRADYHEAMALALRGDFAAAGEKLGWFGTATVGRPVDDEIWSTVREHLRGLGWREEVAWPEIEAKLRVKEPDIELRNRISEAVLAYLVSKETLADRWRLSQVRKRLEQIRASARRLAITLTEPADEDDSQAAREHGMALHDLYTQDLFDIEAPMDSPSTEGFAMFFEQHTMILDLAALISRVDRVLQTDLLRRDTTDRGGAPRDWALDGLIRNLARIYEERIGKRPGITYHGPFVRFVRAVLTQAAPAFAPSKSALNEAIRRRLKLWRRRPAQRPMGDKT